MPNKSLMMISASSATDSIMAPSNTADARSSWTTLSTNTS